MAVTIIDAKGLQCPQPTLKVTAMSVKMKPGDVLEVVADCATFEKDVKEWCTRSKKVMLWMKSEGAAKRCQIQF
jgi:tRNA 2-thiouridine synthesizing protein A